MEEDYISILKDKLLSALEQVDRNFTKVRTGRANPSSLDTVNVDYYGTSTPLKSLATISVPEGNQLLIRPFDKSCLKDIEQAINESNLGYTPNNDGETIRIIIPALTEDRRKELIKQVKSLAEEGKVQVRNIRRDILDKIEKADLPEDQEKGLEKQVQTEIDSTNKKIDEKLKEKESELMTV